MAVHFAIYPATEEALPGALAALIQGALGGGVLGLAGGFMMRKKR